jgi:aspartate aminotransferase
MILSKRINKLSPSLTIEISTLARQLKESGKDILSFSAGEPDFDTPEVIKEAAIQAIKHGHTKYTSVDGIVEVKQAIIDKLKKDNNLSYKLEHIMTNVGAKHSLFNIFQALIDDGDEVIIPAPYWVTYPELALYSGGVPVAIDTQDTNNFKITPQQLKDAITSKTKILILTTPSNPTGLLYSKEELIAISEVLKGTNITIISDEMYEKIIYDGKTFTSVASINEDMFNRTITVNGLSKCVAMTGWRFGYLACPNKDIVKAMVKLQSQSTSNINSITQYAAIPALQGKANKDIEMMNIQFTKRRDEACKLFNEIDGLSALVPDGAFYIFVNIKQIEQDSMKFCKDLLAHTGVAVVPGIGFGSDGYFRFSFAVDLETIKLGIARISDFVKHSYNKN